MISPCTTATAPCDTSWSWKPVSLPLAHVMTQTSTWSSRQSCSKWRSGVSAAYERPPLPRVGGDPADQIAQLARVEIALERGAAWDRCHAWTSVVAVLSSRAGLRWRSAV